MSKPKKYTVFGVYTDVNDGDGLQRFGFRAKAADAAEAEEKILKKIAKDSSDSAQPVIAVTLKGWVTAEK